MSIKDCVPETMRTKGVDCFMGNERSENDIHDSLTVTLSSDDTRFDELAARPSALEMVNRNFTSEYQWSNYANSIRFVESFRWQQMLLFARSPVIFCAADLLSDDDDKTSTRGINAQNPPANDQANQCGGAFYNKRCKSSCKLWLLRLMCWRSFPKL